VAAALVDHLTVAVVVVPEVLEQIFLVLSQHQQLVLQCHLHQELDILLVLDLVVPEVLFKSPMEVKVVMVETLHLIA
jgi:hypothetical protein